MSRNRRRRNKQPTEEPQVVSETETDAPRYATPDDEENVLTTPQEAPYTEVEASGPELSEDEIEEDAATAQPSDELADLRETYAMPDDWTDGDVHQWRNWHQRQSNPKIRLRGPEDRHYWVYDPTRDTKAMGDWDDHEILLWLQGDLANPGNVELARIADEARRRFDIPLAWSNKQVLTYYRKGIRPKQTLNGVWVEDVARAQRSAGEWTNTELEAWLNQEIRAGGQTSNDARLAQEAKKRFRLSADGTSPQSVRHAYRNLSTQVTVEEDPQETPQRSASKELPVLKSSFIESTLSRYASEVAPRRPVTHTQGVRAQKALDRVFEYALRQEGSEFLASMEMIKSFFKEHRDGLFSPTFAYRFTRDLPGSRRTRQNHLNLIELFLIVTDPAQARRKQADLSRLVTGFSNQRATLLLDYFRHYA